jgi:hypothetical protein
MVRLHMASTHNAVVVASVAAVDSYNLDVALAHRAAALLTFLQPRKTSELAVYELLDQLGKEKLERESRGLNHWDKHAPQFLSRIVRQARQDKRRRHQEAEAFLRAKHREAVRFALAIVGSTSAAEIVVAETYRELLEGGATIPGFFPALVCNGRDYLDSQASHQRRFAPLEEALPPSWSSEEDGPVFATADPISHRFDDQDPLDILIAREEEIARERQIQKAKEIARGCRKYRWVRAKNWAQELGIMSATNESVTEMTGSTDR